MELSEIIYKSDYTGEFRYAISVGGKYPIALDFPTKPEMKAAFAVLEWIEAGKPSGYDNGVNYS